MLLQWVATKMLTGDIITDINGLICSEVRQTICRYETVTAQLPIAPDIAPAEWQRATMEGATGYWLLGGDEQTPLWGGYISQATDSEADTVDLSLPTWENYLDQRYTGDRTYSQVGQNDIVKDLIMNCVAAGPNGGLPIRVVYDTPGAGKLRDLTYKDTDDKTVYSALQDMQNWEGGPEWYISGEWNNGRITLVFHVGDRVGTPAPAGLDPSPQFDLPGNVSTFSRVRAFGQGKGANSVIAYSNGGGASARVQSPVQNVTDPDRPTFEYRWSPSTSVEDQDTLTADAQSAVASMKNGSRSISLAADVDDTRTPRLGLDWFLGDDIGYTIGGNQQYKDQFSSTFTDTFGTPDTSTIVPAFPTGMKGTGRAIGYVFSLGPTRTVTPVLAGSGI